MLDRQRYLASGRTLQRLVTDRIQESQDLEFKRDGYSGSERDSKELSRDIAALINAGGPAQLLVGVDETSDNVAGNIVGIPNASRQSDRIRDVVNARIEPRILDVGIGVIALGNGNGVVVVTIPELVEPVHAVRTGDGKYEFWTRDGRGRVAMRFHEVEERLLEMPDSRRARSLLARLPPSARLVFRDMDEAYIDIQDDYQRLFRIVSVDDNRLVVFKLSNEQEVVVPTQVVAGVLPMSQHDEIWQVTFTEGALLFRGNAWEYFAG